MDSLVDIRDELKYAMDSYWDNFNEDSDSLQTPTFFTIIQLLEAVIEITRHVETLYRGIEIAKNKSIYVEGNLNEHRQ